jgi:hypothetical protein
LGVILTPSRSFLQPRVHDVDGRQVIEDTQISQAQLNVQAQNAIKDLFPQMPEEDCDHIIKDSFKKVRSHYLLPRYTFDSVQGKKKVGTATNLSLSLRVQLAVLAHIRHTYTDYDSLIRTLSRHNARKKIENRCLDLLVKWRGDDESGVGDMVDILREVIVISDDDEEDDEGILEDSDQSHRDSSVEFISIQTASHEAQEKQSIDESSFHLREKEPFLDFKGSPMTIHERKHLQSGTQGQKPATNRRGFSRYSKAWDQAIARSKAGTSSNAQKNSHRQIDSLYSQPQRDSQLRWVGAVRHIRHEGVGSTAMPRPTLREPGYENTVHQTNSFHNVSPASPHTLKSQGQPYRPQDIALPSIENPPRLFNSSTGMTGPVPLDPQPPHDATSLALQPRERPTFALIPEQRLRLNPDYSDAYEIENRPKKRQKFDIISGSGLLMEPVHHGQAMPKWILYEIPPIHSTHSGMPLLPADRGLRVVHPRTISNSNEGSRALEACRTTTLRPYHSFPQESIRQATLRHSSHPLGAKVVMILPARTVHPPTSESATKRAQAPFEIPNSLRSGDHLHRGINARSRIHIANDSNTIHPDPTRATRIISGTSAIRLPYTESHNFVSARLPSSETLHKVSEHSSPTEHSKEHIPKDLIPVAAFNSSLKPENG